MPRANLFQLNELLSLLLGTAQFVNHLQGGVQVEAAEAVAEVEHVHARLALKVIDVKSKLCALKGEQSISIGVIFEVWPDLGGAWKRRLKVSHREIIVYLQAEGWSNHLMSRFG